jgi:hypothetical protein
MDNQRVLAEGLLGVLYCPLVYRRGNRDPEKRGFLMVTA